MVVKIYAAAPSCSSAVQYNERKVTEGHASVLFSSGMDDPSRPMDTFSVYERGSLRCQNMSFHASVKPGKDDGMTDEKVKNFVKDYMERMGYGKQPWILYKHTDLERIHYHIVSVRVDKDGKKISDSYERKKSQEALKELAEAYGYTVGKKKDMDANKMIEGVVNTFTLKVEKYNGSITTDLAAENPYVFAAGGVGMLLMLAAGVSSIAFVSIINRGYRQIIRMH